MSQTKYRTFTEEGHPVERILLISDTHNNPRILTQVMKKEKYVDRVFHMGDMQEMDGYIKEVTKAPLEAVRGNCDYDYTWPSETLTQVGNHTIFMTHGHKYDVRYDTDLLERAARAYGADVALYGHTHIPDLQKKEDGFFIVNPGSLAAPRQRGFEPSYIILWHDTVTDEIRFYQKYLSK